MISFKPAAIFIVFGFLLASLAGSPGAAPDKGLGTALMSAVVDSNATLLRGGGATSVTTNGVGRYYVAFNRSVSDCAYVASISDTVGLVVPATGSAGTSPTPTNANSVFVITRNESGEATNRAFMLIVFCPK